MPPVGFEPKISAGERPKTNALDRAATGTGIDSEYDILLFFHSNNSYANAPQYYVIHALSVSFYCLPASHPQEVKKKVEEY